MQFLSLQLLYILVPLLLLTLGIRLWRRPYLMHPLVSLLRARIRTAGQWSLLPGAFLWAGLLALLIACLQPVYPFQLQKISRGGLQIMLVMDISSSMNQFLGYKEEFNTVFREPVLQDTAGKVSKLDAVKAAAREFITRRPNDAIGLEVYSINSYVVSPPTVDHEVLQQYLTMFDINTLIGEGLTSIGEGLNLARRILAPKPGDAAAGRKGRVVILFTDADHNYGRNPLPVIDQIGRDGIHLYLVGLGLGERDIGTEIVAGVRKTGGEYFDARSEQDLGRIYGVIESLEKSRFTAEFYEQNSPAFAIFALIGASALALYGVLRANPNWIEIV